MTTAIVAPSRRTFLLGAASLAGLALSGCATTSRRFQDDTPHFDPYYLQMYGELPNEKFPVPALDLTKLDPTMFRTQVPDPSGERPGTIVVNTSERHLYLVQENGQAIRYGVGIGREGFAWAGKAAVGRKAEWPTWTPPREMQTRQPETQQWATGMPGGLENPLGARAMYIFQDGRDTLYRLHGTLEVGTIGTAVSSGCVRLLFHDIIDLYGRCPVGTPIVVNT